MIDKITTTMELRSYNTELLKFLKKAIDEELEYRKVKE